MRDRWTGWLFAAGSACFFVGPFPGFLQLVGAVADAAVFFVGSLLFTAAAALQLAGSAAGRERTAGAIQFAGTLFFNLSTGRALLDALDDDSTNQLVWRPDAFGSVCFLVASALAMRLGSRTIAILNLAGSVAFGISAVAGYIVPSTGDVLDLAVVNVTTAIGAACFLAGGVLLAREAAPSSRR